MAAAVLGNGFGQDVSGVIVICTPTGLRTVRLDGSNQGEPAQPHAPEDVCPVCVHFAGGCFGTVAAPDLSVPDFPKAAHERLVRLGGVPGRIDAHAFVRGPPHSS